MFEGIDNIGLCVTDLTGAVAFYEKLGFAKAYESERGCTLIGNKTKLFVFQTRQANPRLPKREASLFDNSPGIDHISFLVANVDQTYAELKAKDIIFTSEPADQDWGARVLSLKDPDGNNLFFLQWLKA
jgi:catechol 2,3-dioxygenase-like lactoylglutathione lyase family enzyme